LGPKFLLKTKIPNAFIGKILPIKSDLPWHDNVKKLNDRTKNFLNVKEN